MKKDAIKISENYYKEFFKQKFFCTKMVILKENFPNHFEETAVILMRIPLNFN